MRLTASLIPLLLAGPALAAGDPIAAGKSLVEVNCTRCHNVTGMVSVPPLMTRR